MKILVIDDSMVMRMILERGLRKAGFEQALVVHAGNGLEALTKLEATEKHGGSFDLILTDIHMPVMDGPELLAEMRRRGLAQGVPVVLVTAEDSRVAEQMCVEGGAGLSRLSKPFTMEQMESKLAPLLAGAAHG